jgi:hypothetical protein
MLPGRELGPQRWGVSDYEYSVSTYIGPTWLEKRPNLASKYTLTKDFVV